jgi:hypothetical protein
VAEQPNKHPNYSKFREEDRSSDYPRRGSLEPRVVHGGLPLWFSKDRLRGVVTEIIAENLESGKTEKLRGRNLCFLALQRISYRRSGSNASRFFLWGRHDRRNNLKQTSLVETEISIQGGEIKRKSYSIEWRAVGHLQNCFRTQCTRD